MFTTGCLGCCLVVDLFVVVLDFGFVVGLFLVVGFIIGQGVRFL